MFVDKMREVATNKRVGSRAGRCYLPEPSGSGLGLFVLGVIVPIPPHTPNITHTKWFSCRSLFCVYCDIC
jgi:hypothetical protein